MHAYTGFLGNSQKPETSQTSCNRQTDKHAVEYPFEGLLTTRTKKKWFTDAYDDIDELQYDYAE